MRRLLPGLQYILVTIYLFSCKGGQEIVTPCMPYSKPDYRIKEIITLQNGETSKSEYFYDTLNRIQRRNDSGEYYFSVIWKYTNEMICLLRQDSSVQSYFNIDSNGYAITPSIGHYIWEYDSEGYLLSQSESWPSLGTQHDIYSYTCWNNDKIASDEVDVYGNKTGGGITTNEFYVEKLNTVGNENIGIAYFGKQNNCLIKTSYVTFQGNIDTLAYYTYEFDSIGRVIKEIKTKSGNGPVTRIFKYY